MLRSRRLLVMLACGFAGNAATAVAQTEPPRSWDQETRYGLSQPKQDMTLARNRALQRDLSNAGILDRAGPYRFAMPVASFGEKGPKLLFAYVPRMNDGVGSKVFMFVVRINID